MSYVIHQDGTITRQADGLRFAMDDRLPEYREYVDWLQLGGAPEIQEASVCCPRVLPVAEFRARFTDAEMAAVVMLAYAGAGDVTAAMLLLKLQTSAEIDLASPAVESGLAYLTEKMCLAPGRAEEILA